MMPHYVTNYIIYVSYITWAPTLHFGVCNIMNNNQKKQKKSETQIKQYQLWTCTDNDYQIVSLISITNKQLITIVIILSLYNLCLNDLYLTNK